MADRIRFAIVGTSKRSEYLYGPLLNLLSADAELCAVWGRSEAGAHRLGEKLGVPWFTDLEEPQRDGGEQARLDQEVTLAMEASARRGGKLIPPPLADREHRRSTPREIESGGWELAGSNRVP